MSIVSIEILEVQRLREGQEITVDGHLEEPAWSEAE